jgi:DNA-binding GntR family transcriptional regulator
LTRKAAPVGDHPKWHQVRDGLADDIRSGRLTVGSRVPSPPDLTARFDCDRNTVRKATSYLRDIGVLRTRVGSGTYVAAVPPDVLPELEPKPSIEDRVAALETWMRRHEDGHPPA